MQYTGFLLLLIQYLLLVAVSTESTRGQDVTISKENHVSVVRLVLKPRGCLIRPFIRRARGSLSRMCLQAKPSQARTTLGKVRQGRARTPALDSKGLVSPALNTTVQ